MMHDNPFASVRYGEKQFFHVTAEDRLRAVKTFSLAQCEAALKLADLQKTVARAIESRQKKLKKETKK